MPATVARAAASWDSDRCGVQHPDPLEGRDAVERPGLGEAPFGEEALAEAKGKPAMFQAQSRHEVEQEPETVRHDVVQIGAAVGDRVAAVQALAESETGAGGGVPRPGVHGGRAHHRSAHLQLRQADIEAAAEQARPGPARQQHRIAGDAALFGDRGRDAARRGLDPPDGAVGHDHGAALARGLGDGRGRLLRFRTPVAGRMQAAEPPAIAAGRQGLCFRAAQEARVDLKWLGALQPGLPFGKPGLVADQIEDAVLAEAGFATHPLVHATPEPQAFQHQRKLPRVAAHLAAPAPIAARLLGADLALLAQHDRHAAFGQGRARRWCPRCRRR